MQHLVQSIWSADEGYALRRRHLRLSPDRTHVHVECRCSPGQSLADMSEAEDAQRLAGKLRPERRCQCADSPLAFPLALAQPGVDAPERARERQHGADDVFSDPRLVPISIREMHSRT